MTLSPRHLTTILFLLRHYADHQRRMHGPALDSWGEGIELAPREMEQWADDIEDTREIHPQTKPTNQDLA